MVWSKTVSLILGVAVLFLVLVSISFLSGPGFIRDILPTFYIGDDPQVEWNQVFHIENPEHVVISINPTGGDNYYYRYIPIRQKFGAQAGEIVSSWESHKGSWPVPNRGWNRLVLSDIFSSHTEPQQQLLGTLKNSDFENGLSELLRHYVQNRDGYYLDTNFEIFIGDASRPNLVYEENDPKLKDVDFILETINRLTRTYKKNKGLEWGLE